MFVHCAGPPSSLSMALRSLCKYEKWASWSAVEISSVVRASPESFRVAWIERHYENGQLATTERWSAILTVVVEMPRDLDRLRKNPLGIYVNAINWSRELGQ